MLLLFMVEGVTPNILKRGVSCAIQQMLWASGREMYAVLDDSVKRVDSTIVVKFPRRVIDR